MTKVDLEDSRFQLEGNSTSNSSSNVDQRPLSGTDFCLYAFLRGEKNEEVHRKNADDTKNTAFNI